MEYSNLIKMLTNILIIIALISTLTVYTINHNVKEMLIKFIDYIFSLIGILIVALFFR